MHAATTPNKPTSLKLPAALKSELESDAERAGLSLHAHMVQTLAESVRRTRLREAFAQDTAAALADMKTSGQGYELSTVRDYFSAMALHRKGLQAKPPTPIQMPLD